MEEIPQECDFITWSNQDFVESETVSSKYYITWSITQLPVINNALLTVLFCNCPLVDL